MSWLNMPLTCKFTRVGLPLAMGSYVETRSVTLPCFSTILFGYSLKLSELSLLVTSIR